MNQVYMIKVAATAESQTPDVLSYVGGRPALPPSVPLPTCRLCGAVQSFFFQVAFPGDHAWSGVSLAVFQCTSCLDMDHLLPLINEQLIPSLKRGLVGYEDIPDGALDLYQANCRFLAFSTAAAVLREDYEERVRFRPIELTRRNEKREKPSRRSKVGGRPGWLFDDDSPGLYMGRPMCFLMQIQQDTEFEILPEAPRTPLPPGFEGFEDVLRDSKTTYDLFANSQLYFYGNRTDAKFNIYMMTQLER